MNEEKNRLKTFDSCWPASAPIEANRIAKAGFYYTRIGLEVECYWCKSKISEWHYGDQVIIIICGLRNKIIINNICFR